jgi:hypothetical protein
MVKVMVGTFLVGGIGSTLFGMSVYEYFSPKHTNSVNLFISMLCHLGLVTGPAALFGTLILGHTIYPKKFEAQMTPAVQGFGKPQGFISKFLGKPAVVSFAPIMLMLGSMNFMDSLNLISVVPGAFWAGIATTSIYYKARELVTPLWMARQYYFFGVFAILSQFLLSYKLLQINLSQDEYRKTFANI